jgi:hypothetical protein
LRHEYNSKLLNEAKAGEKLTNKYPAQIKSFCYFPGNIFVIRASGLLHTRKLFNVAHQRNISLPKGERDVFRSAIFGFVG